MENLYTKEFVQRGGHENNGVWLLHGCHPNPNHKPFYDTEPHKSKIGLSITGQKNSCPIDEHVHLQMVDALNTISHLVSINASRTKIVRFKEVMKLALELEKYGVDYEEVLEDVLKNRKIKEELKK